MSSKQLNATVRLNTSQAERKLQQLGKAIDALNKSVNRQSNAYNAVNTALNKSVPKIKQAKTQTDQLANSANKVSKNFKTTNSAVSVLTKNLRTLVSTYVGVMGAQKVLQQSDIITSAENRLNNLEGGNPQLTAESMDKMYAAAQRSRSAYSDMLSNVSKTMTLAGDSFQNNIDNAIRFQEIMAKSYAIGGASDAEASSSMYQLVQALGSGILQGDELRSLREGAPLAYKEIEKFAQGVLKTEDSLKDLASQGVITSDIVVAAIMGAEEKINKSFNNTQMTFGQALESIKSMALKAFEPVLKMLNEALNKAAKSGLLDAIGNAFVFLANVIIWIVELLGKFFNWFAENWYWLQWIVAAVIIVLIGYLAVFAAKAVWAGLVAFYSFLMSASPIVLIILLIGVLIGAIVWLANTTISACDFMVQALFLVAIAVLLIGLITGSTVALIASMVIALIALLLAVFMQYAEQIVGGVAWMGAVIRNIGLGIKNFFIACWNWIGVAWHNTVAGIVNVGMGLWNSLQAVGQNIGIAFQNAWIWAKNAFWEFIADVLTGISKLEPVINGIAKLIGKEGVDFSGAISTARSNKSEYKSFVSVSDAWNSGMNTRSYESFSDAWSSGINTYQYLNLQDTYAAGAEVGANWRDKLEGVGSNLKDKLSGFGVDDITGAISGLFNKDSNNRRVANGGKDYSNPGLLDGLGDILGTKGSGLPNPNNPSHSLGGAYDPKGIDDDIANGLKKLGSIDDNTGSMADAMELADEDLEYLRELAEMEWKREYTTANITVDMSNYNTINGDADLDGIVTKLADKLYEEMDYMANGVYS